MTEDVSGNNIFMQYQNIDFGDFTPFTYEPPGRRRSIIIGTLGDPNITVVDIIKMMEAGMNCARFLTSHSTTGDKIKLIGKVDKAAKTLAKKNGIQEWPFATCIELKTSFVSTGLLSPDRPYVILKANSEVILTHDIAEFDKCNEHQIFVDNPYIVTDATLGMEISIKQDKIILKVTEIYEETVKCVVVKEGMLLNLEPVCMTGATRTRPYITKKDLELVKFAVEYQVDIVIVNYARHPECLRQIKKFIGTSFRRPFLISGICTYEGLSNLDDLIKETDGILLPRELLAYELDRQMFFRMGQIQKVVIGKCRQAGKPIFISGEIFEKSLTTGDLEHEDVADITNSLLEGASGFIIDEWDDPDALKSAIKELSNVCAEIEPLTNNEVDFDRHLTGLNLPMNAAMATAVSSVLLANKTLASLLIIPTVSGRTIYYLNCMRPPCIVIAVTTNLKTFRMLQVYRSVLPLFFTGAYHHSWHHIMKARIDFAIDFAVEKAYLKYGDSYVTLEKGAEESFFCDTVKACKVVTKKNDIRCADTNTPLDNKYI